MEEHVGYVQWLAFEVKRLMRQRGRDRMEPEYYCMEVLFANDAIVNAVGTAADVQHFEHCIDVAGRHPPDLRHMFDDMPQFGQPAPAHVPPTHRAIEPARGFAHAAPQGAARGRKRPRA